MLGVEGGWVRVVRQTTRRTTAAAAVWSTAAAAADTVRRRRRRRRPADMQARFNNVNNPSERPVRSRDGNWVILRLFACGGGGGGGRPVLTVYTDARIHIYVYIKTHTYKCVLYVYVYASFCALLVHRRRFFPLQTILFTGLIDVWYSEYTKFISFIPRFVYIFIVIFRIIIVRQGWDFIAVKNT